MRDRSTAVARFAYTRAVQQAALSAHHPLAVGRVADRRASEARRQQSANVLANNEHLQWRHPCRVSAGSRLRRASSLAMLG